LVQRLQGGREISRKWKVKMEGKRREEEDHLKFSIRPWT